MKWKNELQTAQAISATALGIDFVSGRTLSMFYSQMGLTGWLGVLVSAFLFGTMTAFIAQQARCSGAGSAGEFFVRLPGRGLVKSTRLLYGVIVLLAAGVLLNSAGHMGALILPVRRAELVGAALALLIAAGVAFTGIGVLHRGGRILVPVILFFELALLFFAELPETPRYAVELRMRNNWIAALGFAILHSCACVCVVFGMLVKLSCGRMHTAKLGMFTGGLFGLLLGLGNAVLMAQNERILALKLPFVALCADWGSIGFYLNTGLGWMLCSFSLAGMIYGILPAHSGANSIGK